jgi:CrcB protein
MVDPRRPARRQRARGRRQLNILAVIALGGGLGAVARYGIAQALPTATGAFPWATFLTNIGGCLLIGLLMVYVLDVWSPSRYRRPFLGVGFLGGFTTFSTYAVEIRGLLATGQFSLADAYALTSLVAGLSAVWTGVVLGRLARRLPVRRGPRRREAPATSAAPPSADAPGQQVDGPSTDHPRASEGTRR